MDQGVDDDLSDIAEESVDSAASDGEEVSSEDGRRGRGRAGTNQSKKPAARRTAAPKAKAAAALKIGCRSSKQVVVDDEDSIDGASAVGLQSASKSSMLSFVQPTSKRSSATTSSRSAASRHVEAVDDIVDDEGFVMTAGTSKYISTTQRSIRLPALELDSQQQQSSQSTKKRQLPVSFSQSLNSQHTKKQATASVIDLVSGWDD